MSTLDTVWIRVVENADGQTGRIEYVADSAEATALSGNDANYFLATLRDDPKGYEYDVVPTATPNRYVIATAGQCWLIRGRKKQQQREGSG